MRQMNTIWKIAFCAMAAFLIAMPREAIAQCGTAPQTGNITWTTAWCDEFNGAANSAINAANWTYDTGAGGWGNNLRIDVDYATTDATNAPFILTYADSGKPVPETLNLSAWNRNNGTFAGETVVATTDHANTQNGGRNNGTFRLYGYQLAADPTSVIGTV